MSFQECRYSDSMKLLHGKSESNMILFLAYKYLFLMLLVIINVAVLFEFDLENINAFQLVLCELTLLVGHLAISPLIFKAKVSRECIELSKVQVIYWEQIRKLYRIGDLYFLKVDGKKAWYIFPIQKKLFAFVDRISDSDMDQLIQSKIKNSRINE